MSGQVRTCTAEEDEDGREQLKVRSPCLLPHCPLNTPPVCVMEVQRGNLRRVCAGRPRCGSFKHGRGPRYQPPHRWHAQSGCMAVQILKPDNIP